MVPFSPASGLLEWCEDTTPLGEYLLGGGRRTGGAHGRYHQPGQLTFSDAMAQYNRDPRQGRSQRPCQAVRDGLLRPCRTGLLHVTHDGTLLLATFVHIDYLQAMSGLSALSAEPYACVTLAVMIRI